MTKVRKRGEEIRQFILDNTERHPKDVASLAARTFGISRQAVNKHIHELVRQKSLLLRGTTRSRHYLLHPLVEWERIYPLDGTLKEDLVWRTDVRPRLGELPENALDIWQYGFTEMLNNAIDHSGGKSVFVKLEKTAVRCKLSVYDDGEGIFRKIQRALKLEDERHAVLELSKGKVTTDPKRHTGEGIFFSSRMFDDFTIVSGNTYFSHAYGEIEDWVVEQKKDQQGTGVFLDLSNNTARTTKKVFDSFTADEEFGFSKTVVPVRLAQYGEEKLISRSQAKRLLSRIDRFKVVVFDFEGVETIGQAFADEIFRVFRQEQPRIEVLHLNAVPEVARMIKRAANNQTGIEKS